MTESRHNNTKQHTTTGFARRALLLVSFLMLGLGSAWGIDSELYNQYDNILSNGNQILSSTYENYDDDSFIEFTFKVTQQTIWSNSKAATISDLQNWGSWGKEEIYVDIDADPTYEIQNGESFKIICPLKRIIEIAGTNGGVQIICEWNVALENAVAWVPKPDAFIQETGKDNATNGSGFVLLEGDDINASSGTFKLSEIKNVSNLSGVKYARIYVTDAGGAKLDYDTKADGVNDLLQVTNGKQAGTLYKKNGLYVYNEGNNFDLDAITVTLNAGLGNLNQYKIVVLLSTSEMIGSGSDLKEPQWDYEYTHTFNYPVYQLLDESVVEGTSVQIQNNNIMNEVLSKLNLSGSEFAQHWYASWFVEDKEGDKQDIQPYMGDNSKWTVSINNNGGGWKTFDNKMLWLDNTGQNANQDWFITQHLASNINVTSPNNTALGKYAGYKIIFEVTNEYEGNIDPNNPPKAKFRYIFEIPVTFPSELKDENNKKEEMQEVSSRQNDSYDITWEETKKDIMSPKYVRFYLTDNEGNVVNPSGMLEVTYNGGNSGVWTCKNPNHGFYIYNNDYDLSWDNIQVRLKTREAYKLYKVVGVFASNTEGKILAETGSDQALAHEPDWDFQYIYSFTYSPETKEYKEEIEWRGNGVTPTASVNDPNNANEWNISWKELSLGYYVKWYVVKGNEQQSLVLGTARQANNWVINLPYPFTIQDNKEAVLKGQTMFTSDQWNIWGKPTVYAPSITDYEDDYQIVCEVYSNSDGTGDPNAKYIFKLYKSFLGEINEGVEPVNKVRILEDRLATITELALSDVLAEYTGEVLYARVWLTKTNGTEVEPQGRLSADGMTPYTNNTTTNTYSTYGFYLTGNDDITGQLNNISAKLELTAGSFSQYQIHVAFSKNALPNDLSGEPNYDFVYVLSFDYPAKIVYKELIINKDGKYIPDLLENWQEVAKDCEVEDQQTLQQKLYVRWYLANADGIIIQSAFGFSYTYGSYTEINDNNGYYRFGDFNFADWNKATYNPTIDLPDEYDRKNVRLVCVATTKTDGYNATPWTEDPELQVKYIYTFYTDDDMKARPFVHYQGQAYRYLKEVLKDDERAKERDYIKMGSNVPTNNLTWDISTETSVETTENIRQNVHTWEYDIYVVPGEPRSLMLPFQNYTNGGQNLEPRAYIRWYDWNTDEKVKANGTFTFTKKGSRMYEHDRGLFNLCLPNNPIHEDSGGNYGVGVEFTPNSNFSETIDIACDVSKYSDGLVKYAEGYTAADEKYYLLHEPTLSNRYIFHIRPANIIATKLEEAKTTLEEAEQEAEDNKDKKQAWYDAMSALEEDKGKVVVSLNGTSGSFALRFDHHNLLNYILKKGDNSYVSAEKTQWYAYFEDDNGKIWKKEITGTSDETGRITTFAYNTFLGDGYKDLQGNNKPYGSKDGKIFHVIGHVLNSDYDLAAPVVHYELHFINAPALKLDDIIKNPAANKERTEEYMRFYYDLSGIVDFDGNPKTNPDVVGHEAEYYSTQKWSDIPTSKNENMTHIPFHWSDIQYGFCYPELTYTVKNGWGVGLSPLHGDYIVVKSMNMDGVSDAPGILEPSQPDEYHWWDKTPLYDYTHNVDNSKYGSFLYTDASDESRTIASIPFTANLCNGSSIYFTMLVADMTYSTVNPQLLVRIVGIDSNGNRKRIVAFHTCDIGTVGAGRGSWYQVYGASTLPTNFNTDITQFEAEVINYANGTDGADFAIDQLMIYTSTAKVLLTQTGSNSCDDNTADEENKVQVYMAGEGLQNAFGTKNELQPIYWRICEEGSYEPIKGLGMYPQYDVEGNMTDDPGTFTYGITYVNPGQMNETTNTSIPSTFGWYKVGEQFFFQLANKCFNALEEGKNYYVSVYNPADVPFTEDNATSWGNPDDICSIYSEFFIPRRQYVTYLVPESDGKEGGEITIPCGSSGAEVSGIVMILKVPDDTHISGFRDEKISFDYILCSKNDWNSDADLGGGIKYGELVAALTHYRETYLEEQGLATDYQHETYRKILQDAIDAKLLILAASPNFTYTFSEAGTHYVTCIPISNKIGTTETEICGPFEVIFKLKSSGGPSLTLGFEDVTTYPNGYRVVRVGQEQIRNMQANNNGYLLHIPVNMFKEDPNKAEKTGTLEIYGDYLELLADVETTDPIVTSKNERVAKFVGKTISSDRMYISLNFHGEGINPQTFYEGFTYHMFFQVKAAGAGDDACEAPVNFLLKVVPEFVTWNGSSSQWNNDGNWNRSTRAELYKGEAGGTQNTETKAHPDGYKNNIEINSQLTNNPDPAFVPMKFTYVTVPSNNGVPSLLNLEIGSEGIYDVASMGVGMTGNIQYDLMVRYTEEKCVTSDHEEYDTDAKIYDCEKFYGNWAKEIYFKPRAELVNQHYLTYEKVWVEKELTAGTWTLMSTPLQNTYAGDMYVPYNDADATKHGRQETEAFIPIKMTELKDGKLTLLDGTYSRTKYPIYQKSWGMNEGKVYTKSEDVRKSDYSALLNFPTKNIETTFAEWSHTFNDVWVDYSTWKGFAIRAHKSDYSGTPKPNNALIRLPKADEKYEYYDWEDKNEQQPTTKTLSRSNSGKLFTDKEGAVNGVTYGVVYGDQVRTTKDNAEVTVPVGEVQEVDGYLLVGNPYLCSIDMAVFLKTNENILEDKYWTYEGNEVQNPLPTEIKPLQSFFVKLKQGVTVENATNNIIFTSAMMVGNNEELKVMPKPMMTMTAANDRGKSTATVSVGEEAKNIETLFDSNLNDVPMVYTVAEGQAVSINQLTELDKPIAFGVTCNASDDPVTVTFSDIAQLTTDDVFVVDAVTGEKTPVNEGNSISVQPNDYGRYFLLTGATNIGDKADVQNGIIVSIRNRAVTVTSGEALTLVRATLLDGTTAYQYTGGDTTASFTLTSGVYIIHAENAAGEQQTVKVIVKGN